VEVLDRDEDVDDPPHDARLCMATCTGSTPPPAAAAAAAASLECRPAAAAAAAASLECRPAAAAAAAAATQAWLGRRKPAAAVLALSCSVLGRRGSWLGQGL
jgi:hypothetical protein